MAGNVSTAIITDVGVRRFGEGTRWTPYTPVEQPLHTPNNTRMQDETVPVLISS
jgi:hypothetical protein